MIIQAALVGSVVVAGLRVFYRRRSRPLIYWLAAPPDQLFDSWTGQPMSWPQVAQRVEINYRIASASLGLSILGLAYTPLNTISIPLSLFSSLPQFERSIESLSLNRRVNADVLGASVLIGGVLLQAYFFVSFLQWLFVLNERLAARIMLQMEQSGLAQAMPTLFEMWAILQDEYADLQRRMMAQDGRTIQVSPDDVQRAT